MSLDLLSLNLSKNSAEELFGLVSSARYLKDLISSIIMSDKALAQVVNRSFLHVNGVYKIVLAKKSYSEPEIRLHLWEKGNILPTGSNLENIHNHRWSFHSKVLCGSFKQSLYQVNLCDEGFLDHYRFIAVAPGVLNSIEYSGRANARLSFETIINNGQSYYLYHDVLHMFEPENNDFSATIIVREPYCVDESSVFIKHNEMITNSSRDGLTMLSRANVLKLLDSLLAIL